MSGFIETYRGAVAAWECDHLGHMNVQFYVARASEATWHFLHAIGMGPSVVREKRIGLAAVQQDIRYRREMLAGDLAIVQSGVLAIGSKSLTVLHRLINAGSGEIAMTMTNIGVCMDLDNRKAMPLPEEVRARAALLKVLESEA